MNKNLHLQSMSVEFEKSIHIKCSDFDVLICNKIFLQHFTVYSFWFYDE